MANSNLNIRSLKQYLNSRSQAELVDEIADLVKRFPAVQEYYQVKLSPNDDSQVLNKYKKIIENEFFPTRGIGRGKLSVAKKAISDYRKIGKSPESMADLLLFYVEQGVKFTNEYGDIDAPFYSSMESVYQQVVEWISKYQLQRLFQSRCQKIVEDTKEIGWGFHDTLTEIYTEGFD